MKSWMNSKSCRRWRRIMPSGMVCATRWRATIKTDPGSIIRSPSRKNSEPSRTRSFRKRNAYGSRWSRHGQHQNRNLRKRKNRLRKKLLPDASANPTLAEREYFVRNFSFCAASVRISSEFNRQIVPSDGADLPRQCRAAQQSNGHPHRLQAPQKAHAETAGDGA